LAASSIDIYVLEPGAFPLPLWRQINGFYKKSAFTLHLARSKKQHFLRFGVERIYDWNDRHIPLMKSADRKPTTCICSRGASEQVVSAGAVQPGSQTRARLWIKRVARARDVYGTGRGMMKRGHADDSPLKSSSTNKADMSWLLNAGDDTEERGRVKPTAKARKHCALDVDRSVHDWLLEAPSLYRLASHEGIAGAHPLGDVNGHSSSSLSIASTVAGDDVAGRARPSLHRFTTQAAGCHVMAPNPDDLRSASATRERHFLSRSSSETSLDQSPDSGQDKDCVGDSGRKSWSVSLDESLAIQIYTSRPRNAGSKYGSMAEAARLGEQHGVSPKTIRDIWNRRSWVKVTRAYWTAAEASAYVPRRHRPVSPRENGRSSPQRRGRGSPGDKAG
jgi:hypothetical protein